MVNVNLNNYSYSYANTIGSSLKQPLFKLVCNIAIASSGKPWESQAWRITKVAFHCLVAAIFVIPAGLAWLVGKSITYFSKTQIDYEGLFLAPPQIQIPEELESDQLIDIRLLSDKFNQLNLPNERSSSQTSKQDSLRRLCDLTATENANLYPDDPGTRELFCKQLTIFLRGIIKKIESGEVSKDKQRDILMELAEASTRCYPTWFEVSARLFAEVNGQAETVEVKLLGFLQEYKESVILEFCQKEVGTQWHALNYVRNILGKELGLNTTLNAHDFYAAQNDATFGKGLTKWLFLQRYENVNRLISSVQIMINSQNYDPSYHDFLVNTVKEQGIQDPEEYVASHFYSKDFKLNEAGANLMLRCIGIVK
jgi:hypothetical protein